MSINGIKSFIKNKLASQKVLKKVNISKKIFFKLTSQKHLRVSYAVEQQFINASLNPSLIIELQTSKKAC